jgi:hypothetical protein
MASLYPFLANIANTRLRARSLLSEIISGKIIVESQRKDFPLLTLLYDEPHEIDFCEVRPNGRKRDVENIYNRQVDSLAARISEYLPSTTGAEVIALADTPCAGLTILSPATAWKIGFSSAVPPAKPVGWTEWTEIRRRSVWVKSPEAFESRIPAVRGGTAFA